MPTTRVIVGSALGLHARPATLIAEAVEGLDSPVTLGLPDEVPVDARSALLVMALGVGHGDLVEIAGEDPAAVETVAALVVQDLDA
jgi:phosphocarrier protein HPr